MRFGSGNRKGLLNSKVITQSGEEEATLPRVAKPSEKETWERGLRILARIIARHIENKEAIQECKEYGFGGGKGYLMAKGTIRRLIADRGFGFIQTAEGTDLFFHRSELQGVQFAMLRVGQEVEFEMGQGRDGRPQAVRVRLTKD